MGSTYVCKCMCEDGVRQSMVQCHGTVDRKGRGIQEKLITKRGQEAREVERQQALLMCNLKAREDGHNLRAASH